MPEFKEGGQNQEYMPREQSNEQLENRLAEVHKMTMDCYKEDERLDNEIMELFAQWEQNQKEGKFDQTILNQRMEESRNLRKTINALYTEETEIMNDLKNKQ